MRSEQPIGAKGATCAILWALERLEGGREWRQQGRVVTFYHDFRREPTGRHVLRICRAEACQAMGCEALVARAEARLGVACGGTSADGRVTLEPVYCLGLCAIGPRP